MKNALLPAGESSASSDVTDSGAPSRFDSGLKHPVRSQVRLCPPISRKKLFVNCCHIFRMADVEFYVNADSEPIAEAQGGLFALKAFFLLIIPESCAL
jgi:hypothetical protein